MLPPLLRKAAGDAAFDLALGSDHEWERLGVSGVRGVVWVVAVRGGALLALDAIPGQGEFPTVSWTDVPMPSGAVAAVRCDSPAALFDALRRVRVLLANAPPQPEQQLARRLAAIPTTEASALVKRRVGQGLFREMLLDYWDGQCAVTGLAMPELLRASHAKPWRDSSDAERLDVHNGLLLAVHLDALFDQGFLTFADDGLAALSPHLPPEARTLLGGVGSLRLTRVAERHAPYLAHHRDHVFRRGAGAPSPQPAFVIDHAAERNDNGEG